MSIVQHDHRVYSGLFFSLPYPRSPSPPCDPVPRTSRDDLSCNLLPSADDACRGMENNEDNHSNDVLASKWTPSQEAFRCLISPIPLQPLPPQPAPPCRPPGELNQAYECQAAAALLPLPLPGGLEDDVDHDCFMELLPAVDADASLALQTTPMRSAEQVFDFVTQALFQSEKEEKMAAPSTISDFSTFYDDSMDEYWNDDEFPDMYNAGASMNNIASTDTGDAGLSSGSARSSTRTALKVAPNTSWLHLDSASSAAACDDAVEAEVLEELGSCPSSDYNDSPVPVLGASNSSYSSASASRLQSRGSRPVKKQKTENAKAQHNQAETRRRERIKRGFSLLRTLTGCPHTDRRSIVAAAVFQLERYADKDKERVAKGLPPLVEPFDMPPIDTRNGNILAQLTQAYEDHLKQRKQKDTGPLQDPLLPFLPPLP